MVGRNQKMVGRGQGMVERDQRMVERDQRMVEGSETMSRKTWEYWERPEDVGRDQGMLGETRR